MLAKLWMGKKAIKHPDPNKLCQNCGQPRSKFGSSGPGLCYRCYACNGIETRDLWVEDVFLLAVKLCGFTCDCCGNVQKIDSDDENRNAVINMLESMDGAIKPVFCRGCISNFKTYCSLHFGKASWRHAEARDLEKMVLGFLAQKLKVAADLAKHSERRAHPRQKRKLAEPVEAMQALVIDWRN